MPEEDPTPDLTADNQPTSDLTFNEKLDLILRRLATLEKKVEERFKDTRPIWEQALAEILEVKERVEIMDSKLSAINDDILALRAAEKRLEGRISKLNQTKKNWDGRWYGTGSVSDLRLPDQASWVRLRSLTLPVPYQCCLL